MKINTKALLVFTLLSLIGCFEGPNSSPNSSLNGEIAGKWMLKVENLSSAIDHHYRINFMKDETFEKFDSSCFVGPSIDDSACSISYFWHGKYSKEGSILLLIRKSDSLEILSPDAQITDTMEYKIERLDNEALVISGKLSEQSEESNSYKEAFWRVQ